MADSAPTVSEMEATILKQEEKILVLEKKVTYFRQAHAEAVNANANLDAHFQIVNERLARAASTE